MVFFRARYLCVFLVAVALLLGILAFWIYTPLCGKSSKQIALALLEYRNVTATNGVGALGTALPNSLMLYGNWNPSHDSGPDFAESGYHYDRLGNYFERYFTLSRDFPDGNTWTLKCTVRAWIPIMRRDYWWTRQMITISDGSTLASHSNIATNLIPSDVEISRSLPGTWHVTEFASGNGWNEILTIGKNDDYSAVSRFVDMEQMKEFGKIKVENGFLVVTATNRTAGIGSPPSSSKLPFTARQRIIRADAHKILIIADPRVTVKFLLEKKAE